MIRKAVIPAAGSGTRMLPATKVVAKGLLPVLGKPVIHHIVDEAIASGITEICIVISRDKESIRDYFTRDKELESMLRDKSKDDIADTLASIGTGAEISFVYEDEILGLGHAIYCARDFVGDEMFAVLLGDNIMVSDTDQAILRSLMEHAEESGASVVGLEQVSWDRVQNYGVIEGAELSQGLYDVQSLVEKPIREDAPSNLVVASRYVFTPEIMAVLAETVPGKGGEIQLTDAMVTLLETQKMSGMEIHGTRYDTGNPKSYLLTNLALGLLDPEMSEDLRKLLS